MRFGRDPGMGLEDSQGFLGWGIISRSQYLLLPVQFSPSGSRFPV